MLAFFVEVEVVLSARVAALLVPVANKGAGPELAVEIGRLLYNEVSVHFLVTVMLYLSTLCSISAMKIIVKS